MIARVFGGTGYEFSDDGFFKALNSHEAPLEAPCVFWEIGWAGVKADPDTNAVTVLKLVVSGDMGRAANRLGARGQGEGAAVMGYGQALFEEMRFENGVLINGEALDHRVPRAEDLPASFVSVSQDQGYGPVPFGSKGAGEGALVAGRHRHRERRTQCHRRPGSPPSRCSRSGSSAPCKSSPAGWSDPLRPGGNALIIARGPGPNPGPRVTRACPETALRKARSDDAKVRFFPPYV